MLDEKTQERLGIGPYESTDPADHGLYIIIPNVAQHRFECRGAVLLVDGDIEGEGERVWVHWALMECICGPASRNGVEIRPPLYEVLACGEGSSGSLREPRHTYFGRDGYVFYVNPSLLTWAFDVLGRWFDFD